jgi:hypothetical protein
MRTPRLAVPASILILAAIAPSAHAADRLVNMIPAGRSGETNQDAEPTLAVDPADFARMAGASFTWDNLTGGPMVTATAPIFVSTDRGLTWTMANIVPSKLGSSFPTGDITLSFSSTASGATAHPTSWLYGGILSSAGTGRPLVVLRAQDPYSTALMATLDTRTGNVDQPHGLAHLRRRAGQAPPVSTTAGVGSRRPDVHARRGGGRARRGAAHAGRDRGAQHRLQTASPRRSGRTATARSTPRSSTTEQLAVLVVRDDRGSGATPFTALTDPSDSVAGRFVTNALTLASGSMGQNRLGASNVSIAVDPANSDRVYVAWGDSNGVSSETIHVRRSINRGVDWSADLLTVTGAMNPQVAIDTIGVVGVLYQAVVSGRWETRLKRSNNLDATTFGAGLLLANQSSSTPTATYSPYIGDYASLLAIGRNFAGMFSASNYPDKANFMTGVRYQRQVDWTTHKLYAEAAHTTQVAPSIDPFFFEINTSVCNRLPSFCNICQLFPHLCYPIYDPWWWLKCPMCGITIYIDKGDDFRQVIVYDSLGKVAGRFERLSQPLVEKGVTYNYAVKLKARKGVGFVMKADATAGRKPAGFQPALLVRVEKAQAPGQ